MEYELLEAELRITAQTGAQLVDATQILYESPHKFIQVTVDISGGKKELTVKGSRQDLKEALRALYNEDQIECRHDFTNREPADDTRWLAPDGVHERSNPDTIRCEICGAFYDPDGDDWYD